MWEAGRILPGFLFDANGFVKNQKPVGTNNCRVGRFLVGC